MYVAPICCLTGDAAFQILWTPHRHLRTHNLEVARRRDGGNEALDRHSVFWRLSHSFEICESELAWSKVQMDAD
jgi:hypothetical protein